MALQLRYLTTLDGQITSLDTEVETRDLLETRPIPGRHESVGKRLTGRTIPGNRNLRAVCWWKPDRPQGAREPRMYTQYRRMARTKVTKRSSGIVGHTLVVDLWYMLTWQ